MHKLKSRKVAMEKITFTEAQIVFAIRQAEGGVKKEEEVGSFRCL